jgi:hypothetical protein
MFQHADLDCAIRTRCTVEVSIKQSQVVFGSPIRGSSVAATAKPSAVHFIAALEWTPKNLKGKPMSKSQTMAFKWSLTHPRSRRMFGRLFWAPVISLWPYFDCASNFTRI